jgi:DUF917 family protein
MPFAARRITMDDLEPFAIGAWILGTGGGGDPYHSLLEARKHWSAGKSVELIDPLALDDDDLIACVGQMGAPIALQEKMCDGPVIARTITTASRATASHLGTAEIADASSPGMEPTTWSGELGFPCWPTATHQGVPEEP